jgi:hypothetical protein
MSKLEREYLKAVLTDLQVRTAKICGTVEYLAAFLSDSADPCVPVEDLAIAAFERSRLARNRGRYHE